MGDFAFDSTRMAATLGCSWVNLPVEDFINRSISARPDEIARLSDEYRRLYEVAPDVTEADLRSTCAAELALRGMVSQSSDIFLQPPE